MNATLRTAPLAAIVVLAACLQAGAATWNCYTIYNIENAMRNYAPGDEIVIYPGTYYEEAYIRLDRGAVTFRGSTGNCDDVIIQGPGINTNLDPREGVSIISDGVTVRDLTIRGFYWNGIHVTGENDTDNVTIRNVKIIDCGERYIKGSTNTSNASAVVDNLLIEDCYLEQITALSGHPDNDYVGGIDMMGLNAPVIRQNTFKNIRGATGGGRGAIFLWQGINNCTVERNRIYGCDRSICIGNPGGPSHAYMPGYHSTGGIVRNNFATRGAYIGLELCFTNNLKVYYNTIYSADASYFRVVHIYDSSGQTTNLQLAYNIIRGQILDNASGTWYSTGDITGTTPQAGWFVDPATADLHLTSSATPAIDTGSPLAEVTQDFDLEARGSLPDKGADESPYGAAAPAFVAAGSVASGTGTVTPALPAGIAANDILLLFVETANQACSITNQNGGTWTQVTGSPQGTGTAGGTATTCLSAFCSRYNGTQGAPTVSDSGNHQLARMIAIRGATTAGDPWDVTAGGVEATSDTSGSIPGGTTTVANTLVVVAIATSLPDASSTAKFSGWTNAALSSLTERTDNSINAGNGGGLAIATGGKATAGAYGATAVTLVNAAQKGMMSIAIKP